MLFMQKILDLLYINTQERKQIENENLSDKFKDVIDEDKKEVNGKCQKIKRNHMSKYDIEQYAKECNAYVVRKERKEKNKND